MGSLRVGGGPESAFASAEETQGHSQPVRFTASFREEMAKLL